MKQGLQEHLDMLGLTPRTLSLSCNVPQAAIDRALAGQPISHASAVKICDELSKQHNLDSKRGALTPGELGLKTWTHPSMEDYTMQRMNGADLLRTMEPCDQVRLSAKIFEIQDRERATRAAVEMALRQPEVQRLVQGIITRNQRRPAYASAPASMIYRNAGPDLRQMQAELRRDNARLEELRRRAQRERAGYR